MAGITQAQAQTQLDNWLAALTAISARGQSYTIGERTLTRADLADILDQVKFWNDMVQELDQGGIKVKLATPI